jgi:hypothetical protein
MIVGDPIEAITGPSYEALRSLAGLEHIYAFKQQHLRVLKERDELLRLADWIPGAVAFSLIDPDVPSEAITSARERLLLVHARLDAIHRQIDPLFEAWMADFNMPKAP